MIDFENHRSDKTEYLYHQVDVDLNFHRHTHRSFEVAFVFEGTLRCDVDESTYDLHSNEGILILPGQIHSFSTVGHSKSYLCVFSTDWVYSFYNELRGNHFASPCFTFEDDYVCRALQDKENNKYIIHSLLYGLCGRVFANSALLKTNQAHFAMINSIAFYIQDNYQSNITLKEIAEKFGYNYCYLSSFFSKYFGTNFSSYVNRFRTQLAREYLTTTDTDITEISNICGFETIRNFNRVFKNECGVTPKEYRTNSKTLDGQ